VRTALALVIAALVAAGCSGDDGGGESTLLIPKEQLARLVLQPRDVGRRYVPFDVGRQLFADNPEAVDPKRFGRIDGWKARYRLPPSAGTRGPLVIESRADLFETSDGASEELERLREEVGEQGDPIDAPPKLGEDRLAVGPGAATRGGLAIFTVVWRDANATARLTVQGIGGRVTASQAFALARKQQLRIALARPAG
jgi:hypothetical protein